MVTVNSLKILKKIKNHKDGELFYVKDEKQGYVWNDAVQDYIKVDQNLTSNGKLNMNLYEINKSIIGQMEPLNNLDDLKDTINSLFTGDYYLLYGKELSYFTLFQRMRLTDCPQGNLGEEVIDCLKAFEKVYSFEVIKEEDEVKSIEIWVHNKDNNLASVLYLFDYKDGVVYYG